MEAEMALEAGVAIVGGGISGLSLASALARDGIEVTVLEASVEYEDRVRGESLVPWGVAEAKELGVFQTLMDAGARITPEWVHYDALVPTDVSLANPMPAGMVHPDAPGSLNLRHPEACSALAVQAVDDGATLMRGVSGVTIEPGPNPVLRAAAGESEEIELHPGLVLGADGRNSTIRRQVGIELDRHGPTHMMSGLLVDGLDDLDLQHDFLASSDDLFMAAFRQHDGQLRLYLCPGMSQKSRFAGHSGLEEFLRSADFDCLPFGDRLATANPIGPLATYPGDDTWTPEPYVDGVALIGDAAGHNSPIIGQGLSIAMRDARMVRDAIRSGSDFDAGLVAYADERMERMRRLREAAMFMAAMAADDCDNSIARRAKFFELQQTDPLVLGMLIGMWGGPETGPPEAFDGRLREALVAA
jgi:2-polyprenyl-6-methoxyphenol hydroxylase-like FAD-dependent oxidoreductase